LKYFDTVD